MVLPAKGQIAMSQIREHYEDQRNDDEDLIALQDYYRGGTYVARYWGSNANIPLDDDIAILDFRGQGNKLVVTYDIIGGGGGGGSGSNNANNKGTQHGSGGSYSRIEVFASAPPNGSKSLIKRITARGGKGGRGSDENNGSSTEDFKPAVAGEPTAKGEKSPLGGAGGNRGNYNKSGEAPANTDNCTGAGGGGGGGNKDADKSGVYNRDPAGQGGSAGERLTGSFTIDPCPKWGYIKIRIANGGIGGNDRDGGTIGGRGNGGYVSIKVGSGTAKKYHRRTNSTSLIKTWDLGLSATQSDLW
jgi:hypothetical protein